MKSIKDLVVSEKIVEQEFPDYLLRKARTESDIELNNSTIYVNHELGQLNHAEAEVAAKKLQEIDVAMSVS